jgi:hypothetical protein
MSFTVEELRCVVDGHNHFVHGDEPHIRLGNIPGAGLDAEQGQFRAGPSVGYEFDPAGHFGPGRSKLVLGARVEARQD